MKLNKKGIDLIKKWEGCRLTAYKDIVGVTTIGYGHTGSDVQPDSVWTQELCDQVFESDLNKFVSQVSPLVKTELTDNEFSAIISLAYNVGVHAFEKSTLLRLINLGNIVQASKEFPKWDKAGGKSVQGLLNRRLDEQKLFLSV